MVLASLLMILMTGAVDGCEEEMRGDGVCHRLCMTAGNSYDSAASGLSDCAETCEVHCPTASQGDGICDPNCNTWDCGWDLGDCGECAVGCGSEMIGEGNCDVQCNTEVCSYDAGDCASEDNPFQTFVTSAGVAAGTGSSQLPNPSLANALEALWLPYNAVFLLSGAHFLSSQSPSLLSSKGLKSTIITTLYCQDLPNDHIECSDSKATVQLTPSFPSISITHDVNITEVVFNGSFSLVENCEFQTCKYCPYTNFDTDLQQYVNDREETIDMSQYADQSLCEEYHKRTFISVVESGRVTLRNVLFASFRMQLGAVISNTCGLVTLRNVDFYDCMAAPTGLNSALLTQSCPDAKSPYYCGNFTYVGGTVSRLNSGYEYRTDIVLSGFLSMDGLTKLTISHVTFEYNFLPIGESATSASSAMIVLKRFREAELTNCLFQYNVANWSCGVAIINSLKFAVVLDANNFAVDQNLTHFLMENTTFRNNTAMEGTALFVNFQASHQNVRVENCTFDNNFSLQGGIFYVKNSVLTARYANGGVVPTTVRGTVLNIIYPPRYINITKITVSNNYGQLLGLFHTIGNLILQSITFQSNGQPLLDIITPSSYVISTLVSLPGTYITAISLQYPVQSTCEKLIDLDSIFNIWCEGLWFVANNCPDGSPGISLSGTSATVTASQILMRSVTFDSNSGSGVVTLTLSSEWSASNLTFSNNTNHNNSNPVCLDINMAVPADITLTNCSFTGNNGDSATIGTFIGTKSVNFYSVVVTNNTALYSGAGMLFSPYPYAPSSLIIVDSRFAGNVADSFGVVTILDFQGVLSGNLLAIVTLQVDNCIFEENKTKYQGASLTLNNFIQFSSNSQITNCRFLRNASERGGGISMTYQTGKILVRNCWFEGNIAPEGGAGIFAHQYENNNSNMTLVEVRDCTFLQNTGSAVVISGYAKLSEMYASRNLFARNSGSAVSASTGLYYDSDSVYINNTASYGPALNAKSSAKVVIFNALFTGNNASISGGAIFASSYSTLLLQFSLVANNSAVSSGGGIYGDSSYSVEMLNCTVTNNYAQSRGSAVYSYVGLVVVNSSVISSNRAGQYASLVLIEASALIVDSDVWANYAAERTSGVLIASSNLTVIRSRFSAQTSVNGGFIFSLNNGFVNVTDSNFAQGKALYQGGAISASLESLVTLTRSRFTDCASGYKGGTVFLSKSTLIADQVTVLRSGATTGGGFHAIESQLSVLRSRFENFTASAVRGDSMQSVLIDSTVFDRSNEMAYRGGGVYLVDCVAAVISNSEFTRNRGRRGGAVYTYGSGITSANCALSITSCRFLENYSYSGGALESDGADIQLTNSDFESNVADANPTSLAATNGKGGASVIRCDSPAACKAQLSGNTFTRNTATTSGGAVLWQELVPAFANNSFSQNFAIYGSDIASFATFISAITDTNTRIPYEDSTSEVPLALTLNDFASGQQYIGNLKFALFDSQSQFVTTDNSSSLELVGTNDTVLSGQFKAIAAMGVFTLSDFAIQATPGSTQVLKLVTNGINVKAKQGGGTSLIFHSAVLLKVVFRPCAVGESEMDHSCVVCPAETYSLDPKKPCKTCLSSAICYGGLIMVPRKGYWRAKNDTDVFFSCLNPDACTGSPDPPYVSLTGQCADGYTGNLCQVCVPNYSRNGRNNCGKCPGKTANVSVSTLIIVVALCAIGLVVALAIRGATRPRSLMAIYFKIFLNYLQMVVVAASLNLNWPNFVRTFLSSQEMAGGMADQLFSFECLMKDVSATERLGMFASKLIIGGLLPLCLMLISALAWTIFLLIRRVDLFLPKLISSFVIILFIVHPSVTKMMFSVYSCMEILPGEHWIIADLSEKCWTNAHFQMIFLISVPSLAVWVLGLPTLVLAILVKLRLQLGELKYKLMFSFLYKGYEQKWFYWEFVILYRKIAIVSSSVFLSPVSIAVESLTVLAILLLSIYLQLRYQPFNDPTLNKLEVKSILVSAITIYTGLYYSTQSIGEV